MSSATHTGTPYYFVPGPSRHPVMAAAGLFFVILGASQWVNGVEWGKYALFAGLIGWLAVLCLGSAGLIAVLAPQQSGLMAACWRMGLALSALWLAIPTSGGRIGWKLGGPILTGLVLVVGLTRNAKGLLVLLPLFLAILILVVLSRRKPGSRSGKDRGPRGNPGG